MFPLLGKDVPHIEEKIISYLGPVDLIRAQRSSRKWDRVIQKRIDQLRVASDPAVMIQLYQEIMKGEVQSFKLWFSDLAAKIASYVPWNPNKASSFMGLYVEVKFATFCHSIHPGRGCLCLVDQSPIAVRREETTFLLAVNSTDTGLQYVLYLK